MTILAITGTTQTDSGLGRYSKEVISGLRKKGVQVIVLAQNGERDGTLEKSFSARSVIKNALIARKMARNASVVHAFDAWPFALYGWLAVLGTRKRYFVTGLGTYSIPPARAGLKRWLFMLAYKRASFVLPISEYISERIAERGIPKEKLKVIHMGITQLSSPTDDERHAAAKKFGISTTGHPVVLTVGELKERKGQLDTLRAIEHLVTEFPEIQYLIVGRANGEYAEVVRSYIATHNLTSHARVITDATDSDLAALYALSDIVALNSITDEEHGHVEGFGLSIVEGYQFGKPAVGSRGTGVAEAVEEGVTGYVAAQHDPEDIARAIRRVWNERDALGKNALKRFSSYSWEKTADAYLREYRD